ncbi:MAG TPA: DUF4142 domain-containing protein [Sphingomonas sp.]|nr:DUF4142 domain-containing protein [Sphingomonas sp.]
MMRLGTLTMVSATALALAACGSKTDTTATTTNTTATTPMNDTAMAPMPAATATGAQGFANAMAASDAFEIASSKLALTQATSPAVKTYATQMIAAHEKSTAKLKTVATSLATPLTPDPTLAPDQQAMMDSMTAAQGSAFDAVYATNQTAAHQATLDKLKAYAATGDDAKLKELATGMVPIVTAHLNMAKKLK